VTVRGTGCPDGAWGEPVLQSDDVPFVFTSGSGGLYDLEQFLLTPTGDDAGGGVGSDGAWTATGTVPMVPPGPATLTGRCMAHPDDDGGSIEFDYLPGLRVTVTTPDQLETDQGIAVQPGTTLDVNLLGPPCPGPSDAEVDLYSASQLRLVTATASTISRWQFALALPQAMSPGPYRLEADCLYSRGDVDGSYAPLTITVK